MRSQPGQGYLGLLSWEHGKEPIHSDEASYSPAGPVTGEDACLMQGWLLGSAFLLHPSFTQFGTGAGVGEGGRVLNGNLLKIPRILLAPSHSHPLSLFSASEPIRSRHLAHMPVLSHTVPFMISASSH